MRVAIVHDWLTGMRGGEKCLEVACRMFPDARLFTLLHRRGSTSAAIERLPITTSFLQRVPGITRHYRYTLPLMPRAVESLAIPADVDLVLSFSHAVAKSVAPPPGVPHVCYCFTPMRYAWQLRTDYFGDQAAAGRWPRSPLALARNLVLDHLQAWDCSTSHRVTHFVAISRAIAARIAACYGRASEVIYPPVDVDFYTPDDSPREDYYLCVSALAPYKRIDLAIEACRASDRRLVVIGAGPEGARLRRRAGPSVQFLGWQSNSVIREHLRRCRALLFPGHEDFGIVPLEAQACGTPVVALARGGALETVLAADGSTAGTGIFFSSPTPEALAAALDTLEARRVNLSPSVARARAEQFATPRFERELAECLARAVRPMEFPAACGSRSLAPNRTTENI